MIQLWKMKWTEKLARMRNEKLMSCGSELLPPAAN